MNGNVRSINPGGQRPGPGFRVVRVRESGAGRCRAMDRTNQRMKNNGGVGSKNRGCFRRGPVVERGGWQVPTSKGRLRKPFSEATSGGAEHAGGPERFETHRGGQRWQGQGSQTNSLSVRGNWQPRTPRPQPHPFTVPLRGVAVEAFFLRSVLEKRRGVGRVNASACRSPRDAVVPPSRLGITHFWT